MKRRRLLFVLASYMATSLLFLVQPRDASSAEGRLVQEKVNAETNLIQQADKSFMDGNFANAERLYEEALAAGIDNGHLYYNLANAQYRLNKIGRAIANYRRALEQLPRDRDIRANLSLARSRAVDKLYTTPPARSGLYFLNEQLSRDELKLIALVAYMIFWGLVLLQGFKRSALVNTATVLSFLATAYLGLSLFGVKENVRGKFEFSLNLPSRSERQAIGVVAATEAKVFSGDGENFQVIQLLHDGAEIETLGQRGDWIRVVTGRDKIGWVQSNQIELIR